MSCRNDYFLHLEIRSSPMAFEMLETFEKYGTVKTQWTNYSRGGGGLLTMMLSSRLLYVTKNNTLALVGRAVRDGVS
jgi:hypothetical protein